MTLLETSPCRGKMVAMSARWLLVLAVPSVLLGVLLRFPVLDAEWELPWVHLVLVVAIGGIGVLLALLVARLAARTGNTQILLLALSFYVVGVFLMVHALLTPEALLPFPTTGVEIALVAGFLLSSALLAASGLPFSERVFRAILRGRAALFLAALAAALSALLLGLLAPSLLADGATGGGYGDLNPAASAGASLLALVLLAVATVPYYRHFRLTGLPFHHAVVTGLLLLQVAAVSFIVSSVWHVRWEYHLLLVQKT
jgi:hypothetical protein